MKTDLDTLTSKNLASLSYNYKLTADLLQMDITAGETYGAFCMATMIANDQEQLAGLLGLLVRREMMAKAADRRQMALSE